MEHTPGPWKIGDYVFDMVKAANGAGIASCARLDNAEANARLIAAAPELLAALARVTAHLELYTGNGCTSPGDLAQDDDAEPDNALACDLARAAIAKATGEA